MEPSFHTPGPARDEAPFATSQDAPVALHHDAELAHAWEGLPLELVKGYITVTGCTLQDYLAVYREQAQGAHTPLAVVCDLTLARLRREQPAAAALLCACSLLGPEAIPEELFTRSPMLPDVALREVTDQPHLLDQILATLQAYRLIERLPSPPSLCMSGQVQSVLRETLSIEEQQRYGTWMVCALHDVIRSLEDEDVRHVQQIAWLSKRWTLMLPEAAELFIWAAERLCEQRVYREAEALLHQALNVYQRIHETAHPAVAMTLYRLGSLHQLQQHYREAERFFLRTNLIRARVLGPEHPDTLLSLCSLADLYAAQSKREEAEILYQKALTNSGVLLGPEHPITRLALSQLAILYQQWILDLDATAPFTTAKLSYKLAFVYAAQGVWHQAEMLAHRALELSERMVGSMHLDTVQCMEQLVLLYREQAKVSEAQTMLQRVLRARMALLGPDHPDIAASCNALAETYLEQGQTGRAASLLQQALAICTDALEPTDPTMRMVLDNLATVYRRQGKWQQAISLMARLPLRGEPDHVLARSDVVELHEEYQNILHLLRQTSRKNEKAGNRSYDA
ncbi:MAG: tetratricopeptide repeat protein [Ktedonobacteraceae bacterium]|nr:tetratricopeptide repeat protein [Ktedonobacteraceae bacterium]